MASATLEKEGLTMAEYIEREALKEHLMSYAGMFTDELGFVVRLDAVLCGIDFQPAADVAPVVHSFWESYDTSSFGGYKDGEAVWWKRKFFRCERCRKGTAIKTSYCPNCGAKMAAEV